jgi:hypothetical protein
MEVDFINGWVCFFVFKKDVEAAVSAAWRMIAGGAPPQAFDTNASTTTVFYTKHFLFLG